MMIDPSRNMNMQSSTYNGTEFLTFGGFRIDYSIEVARWLTSENIIFIAIIKIRTSILCRHYLDLKKYFQTRQVGFRPDGTERDTMNEHLTRGPHEEVTPFDFERIHRPLDLVVVGVFG